MAAKSNNRKSSRSRSDSGSSSTRTRKRNSSGATSRKSNGRSASEKVEKYRFAQNVLGDMTAAEREYREYVSTDDGMSEPDLLLTVPVVKVDRIHLAVENLDAHADGCIPDSPRRRSQTQKQPASDPPQAGQWGRVFDSSMESSTSPSTASASSTCRRASASFSWVSSFPSSEESCLSTCAVAFSRKSLISSCLSGVGRRFT